METILIDGISIADRITSLICLNPFYIMETILIFLTPRELITPLFSLNPFYIMETILIGSIRLRYPLRNLWVLIHSTSWKLFWSTQLPDGAEIRFYVLIHSTSWKLFWSNSKEEAVCQQQQNVLIHSTSWKLFWYVMLVLLHLIILDIVLIHSTSWKLFWSIFYAL